MAHTHKKQGKRKDKKTARMREDLERRIEEAQPPKRSTDQWDVQTFKPGSRRDRNVDPTVRKERGR